MAGDAGQVLHAFDRGKTDAGGGADRLEGQVAQLETLLAEEAQAAEAKLAVIDDAQRKLADAFKALAADALESNNQSFLELAKRHSGKFQETAKGDLEKRQQAIQELVKPVKESLDKVDAKINELEKARAGAYSGLTEQVKSLLESQRQLQSETSNLVKALRRPQVRGRWGEIQLRSGWWKWPACSTIATSTSSRASTREDGRLRPDLLVRLPGRRTSWSMPRRRCRPTWTPSRPRTRKPARPGFRPTPGRSATTSARWAGSPISSSSIRPRSLWSFFCLARSSSARPWSTIPSLIELGVEQNVIIATPTTLIALLRAVAYGWRQERLAENAKEISDLGKDLYKRLASMGEPSGEAGQRPRRGHRGLQQGRGFVESRVLVTARKFKELGRDGHGRRDRAAAAGRGDAAAVAGAGAGRRRRSGSFMKPAGTDMKTRKRGSRPQGLPPLLRTSRCGTLSGFSGFSKSPTQAALRLPGPRY